MPQIESLLLPGLQSFETARVVTDGPFLGLKIVLAVHERVAPAGYLAFEVRARTLNPDGSTAAEHPPVSHSVSLSALGDDPDYLDKMFTKIEDLAAASVLNLHAALTSYGERRAKGRVATATGKR